MKSTLAKFKDTLENAKSAMDYKKAYNTLVIDLSKDVEYIGVDVDSYMNMINTIWTDTPVKSIEKTVEKPNGDRVTTTKQLFKKPEPSFAEMNRLQTVLNTIKVKQQAAEKQEQLMDMLSNQPKADRAEVGKALKAILFNSKVTNTYSNINKILSFIEQSKKVNNSFNNKCLFYMSNSSDGEAKGGNGKSFVIDAMEKATDELQIPTCKWTIPTWRDTEITPDFANNLFSFASEQKFAIDNSAYDIMDKSFYQTKQKYEKSVKLRSMTNFIGTTNDTLTQASQTLKRRIDVVYCNENMVIQELTPEQKKQLPTAQEITDAWIYLLTHNCSDCLNKGDGSNNSISNTEKQILWTLVDWKDMATETYGVNIKNVAVRSFKELCTSENKKIPYTSAIPMAIKYGATVVKKGSHGRITEAGAVLDLSTMEIPTDIFADDDPFTLPSVYELIDKEYGTTTPTPPTDDNTHTDKPEDTDTHTDPEEQSLEEFFAELGTCSYKDQYQTDASENYDKQYGTSTVEGCQFETINPMKKFPNGYYESRRDANVATMRNMVFEMDDTPLQEQKQISKELIDKGIVNRVVFSGNKSLHMRVTLDREPEEVEQYKFIWSKINDTYFKGKADTACRNPSRLTRKMGAIRNNGKKQIGTVIKTAHFFKVPNSWISEYNSRNELNEIRKAIMSNTNKKHTPTHDWIVDEIQAMIDERGTSDVREKALALATNDGTLSYEEAASAVKYIFCLGFTVDEVKNQIDFGEWNFRDNYLEKLAEDIA